MNERFRELQARLVPLWRSIGSMNSDPQTIVVIPSLSVDLPSGMSGGLLQAYEERFLFLLLLLRQPRARLVYVTSQTIMPVIVEYYLGLLPGVIPSHARSRLKLLSAGDGSSRSLSEKILEKPGLIAEIRECIADPERAHMVPFNVTALERDLALALGIPMYAADPEFMELGTKSGSRKLFFEEGVPFPRGFEDIADQASLAEAIIDLRKASSPSQVIVKLNEGVGGFSNAAVDLNGLPPSGDKDEQKLVNERIREMTFELEDADFDDYMSKLESGGGIVEERITGTDLRSPSVQLRVTPLGELEVLSTHDQLLGGSTGQTYLGATFPADTEYAASITSEAIKIGERLAKDGVIGRFAVDFVVTKVDASWQVYAIELNLRKGGTTHPFLTLQFLTDGKYDPSTAEFRAPSGELKYFVASDHVESEIYTKLSVDELFDIVVTNDLHFHQSTQTGVVFHMISALSEFGRLGMTAVANSHKEAEALYSKAIGVLDSSS